MLKHVVWLHIMLKQVILIADGCSVLLFPRGVSLMDYFDLCFVLWCLVSNLVSPLLYRLYDGLDNGSLGNLSDRGKGVGPCLR